MTSPSATRSGFPAPSHTSNRALSYARAAPILELLGWRRAAVWAYRRALRRHAADAELHQRLGETLATLGRWDDAAETFRRAVRLRPDCREAHGNLVLALHRAGRDRAVLEALRALATLPPQRAELHMLLGAWLRRRGQSAEALRAFRAALSAERVPATTRFFLGEALLGVAEWRALVSTLEQARGVVPGTGAVRVGRGPALASRGAAAQPSTWGRARHGAGRAAAWLARQLDALGGAARRSARACRRVALLAAGRWHARAGRAPLAIRCFREAQALAAPAASHVRVRTGTRAVALQPRVRAPGLGTPWLVRRRPALP